MNTDGLLATVDLGSNSFRLLIARVGDDQILKPLDQIKETVRLAAGLDKHNSLTEEAQARALDALARFSERLVGFSRNQVRVVATSSLRVAKNADEFIAKAKKVLGFNIEVISGNEEARLIYIGAMHSLSYSTDKRLVIDIGGGSTEFIIGSGYKPQIMESVTIGCVSMSMRYFPDGELTENNFNNAILAASGRIQAMEHLFVKHDWIIAIGTSGTAEALYDLCIEYGFSDQITYEALCKLKDLLIQQHYVKKLDLIGIKDDRRPVIAGGLSIMLAIFKELNIEDMTIADGSLREGVMYDLLGRTSDDDLRLKTVEFLKKRYLIDIEQGKRVSAVTLQIYQNLVDIKTTDLNRIKLLQWATELYEIGLSISHNDYHKHGAYILANADIAGFSKPEQTILADLVRAHRGNLTKALSHLENKGKVKLRLIFMVVAFRLSVIFNRNRKNFDSATIMKVVHVSDSEFELVVDSAWLQQNPLTVYSLNEEILQWKKFGVNIKLVPQVS